jgi:hypothetical protein
MKAYRFLIATSLLLAALIAVISGCEYKNAPNYFKQKSLQKTTVITQMDPPIEASGGANYITIQGENFSSNPDSNKVYFDGYLPDIVSNSPTSIKVRRPNLVGDSITVKVMTYGALEIAKYGPYKITQVFNYYGGFVASPELKAIAVDKEENAYVIEKWPPYTMYKISANGERVAAGAVSKGVSEALMGPNGKLILLMNQNDIMQKDVTTGDESIWASLAGKVSFADFDSSGCLYAGGNKTDLYVVKPDLSSTATGVYTQYNIKDVRVYGGYVYVFAENSKPDAANPKLAIWQHRIEDTNGTLGGKQLFLDWSKTGEYASATVNDIAFSANGTLYIGTNYTQPIFIQNPDGSQDILYKGILPTSALRLAWGTGNYLYVILGGQSFDVIRIDMGQPGAPYFGR